MKGHENLRSRKHVTKQFDFDENALVPHTLVLDEDDDILSISGTAWGIIDSLEIKTVKEKVLKVGNSYGGEPFQFTKKKIAAIEIGVAGENHDTKQHLGYLHSLKLYYEKEQYSKNWPEELF